MKNSIQIKNGKQGYCLKVNGMYISNGFYSDKEPVKAIKSNVGIPYGATEWVSIKAIRNFWSTYMLIIIASTKTPYESIWGQLVLIEEK